MSATGLQDGTNSGPTAALSRSASCGLRCMPCVTASASTMRLISGADADVVAGHLLRGLASEFDTDRERHLDDFIDHVQSELPTASAINPAEAARACSPDARRRSECQPPYPNSSSRRPASHAPALLDDWCKLVQNGVPEGQRNSTIAALTGHLLWHGVDAAVVLGLLLVWNRLRCRPPLDDAEVVEVVGNVHSLRQEEDRAERHSRWPTC